MGRWVAGSVIGFVATAAAAAPAEQASNIAIFVIVLVGCVALALLRRRA